MPGFQPNKMLIRYRKNARLLIFAKMYSSDNNINLLDVRRKSEFDTVHLLGAVNFPLDFINRNMSMLDKSKKYYIHCAGGFRSVIASSILKSRGFHNLVNIKGGFKAFSRNQFEKNRIPSTEYRFIVSLAF